jgi:Ca2+-binding RTX toxin-like protein
MGIGTANDISSAAWKFSWRSTAVPTPSLATPTICGTPREALYGDGYYMSGSSRSGADSLYGGIGNDGLYGDAYSMSGQSADPSTSETPRDMLFGGDGNDTLYGDAYQMSDSSRGGNDWLEGGQGSDVIYGDARYMSGLTVAGSAFAGLGLDELGDNGDLLGLGEPGDRRALGFDPEPGALLLLCGDTVVGNGAIHTKGIPPFALCMDALSEQ